MLTNVDSGKRWSITEATVFEQNNSVKNVAHINKLWIFRIIIGMEP